MRNIRPVSDSVVIKIVEEDLVERLAMYQMLQETALRKH